MYTVRELKPDEHEKWNAFLARSPQGTLFHRLDWNQMLVETDPQTDDFLPLICVDKEDKILAALTVPYRIASNRRLAGSPFFGFSTPMLADSLRYAERHHTFASYSALVDLTKALVEHIPTVRLQNSPDIWDIRAYMFNAWKTGTVYTHVLVHTEDGWQNVDPDLQTNIQRLDGKLCLEIAADEKWDDIFAAQNPQINAEVLKKRLAWMRHTGTGRLFALTNSLGQPVSFTLAMLSQPDGRAYLWGSTCLDAKTELQIMPCLFWQVCASLATEYSQVDLGYSSTIQVSQIKDKLGGRLLPTFVTSYPKDGKPGKSRPEAGE
jgi:hypothetical protein